MGQERHEDIYFNFECMKYFRSLINSKVKNRYWSLARIGRELKVGDVFKVVKIENNANICYAVCECLNGYVFWVEKKRLKTSGEFQPITKKEYLETRLLEKLKE